MKATSDLAKIVLQSTNHHLIQHLCLLALTRQNRCGSRISKRAEKLFEWPLYGVADKRAMLKSWREVSDGSGGVRVVSLIAARSVSLINAVVSIGRRNTFRQLRLTAESLAQTTWNCSSVGQAYLRRWAMLSLLRKHRSRTFHRLFNSR